MRYILIVICVCSIISCNDNNEEEFIEFIETNEQGEIIGKDINEQWAPRILEEDFPEDSPLITTKPAYPNPFSNTTTIELALTTDTNVTIEVLDKPGNVIATFIDERIDAGFHHITFNPDLPSQSVELEAGKIYQLCISAKDVEIQGNVKFDN